MRELAIGTPENDERCMNAAASFGQRVAPGVRVTFEAERVIDRVKSAAHETVVIDNASFGRTIMIDGAVRTSNADEFIYHEMMSHVPMLAHGDVERVLIVGGADCGLAEEVLKHHGVRTLVQVEADPLMVKLARSYFAGISDRAFNDGRFELRSANGSEFVASTEERFDLILVALADPGGTTLSPLTEEFLRDARGCLRSGGLLVARLAVPFLHPLEFSAAVNRLSGAFSFVAPYLVPVPSIFGGPVAIGWASNILGPDTPGLDVLAARFADARIETHYYTPEVHRASFALPRYIKDAVSVATRPDVHCERRAPEHALSGTSGLVTRAAGEPTKERSMLAGLSDEGGRSNAF